MDWIVYQEVITRLGGNGSYRRKNPVVQKCPQLLQPLADTMDDRSSLRYAAARAGRVGRGDHLFSRISFCRRGKPDGEVAYGLYKGGF